MRILIIDDDLGLAEHLARHLADAGHVGEHGHDALEGLRLAEGDGYDAIVLDPSPPGGASGLALLHALRTRGDVTPLLLLSEHGAIQDRVAGLRGGADDYLVKPFAFPELLARLEALARRSMTWLRVADLELDRLSRTVRRAGQVVDLQPMEYRLLETLMRHAGRVLSRPDLVRNMWGNATDPQTNIIDVHVSRLRQKIDQPFEDKLIHTVRGGGYRLGAA